MFALAVAVVALIVPPALAHDLIIPPWWGQPGTVHAEWNTWAGFPANMAPDSWSYVPYHEDDPPLAGTPYAHGDPPTTRNHGVPPREWTLQLWNPIEFWLPNFDKDNPKKDVWIQITYATPVNLQYFNFHVTPSNGLWFNTIGTPEGKIDHGDLFYTEAYSFFFMPNPSWETIEVQSCSYDPKETGYPVYLDQVVIDTRCVPEPATLALVSIGLLGLAGFIRRKR